MTIIQHTTASTTSDTILYNAQIITKAFSDAIDQNECNLKIPIAIEQEIQATLDTLMQLKLMANPVYPSNPIIPGVTLSNSGIYTYVNPAILGNPTQSINLTQATQNLKNNCLNCKLGLPKIKINDQFAFSFNNLKNQLAMYENFFKSLKNPNFCQGAYAFSFACLPDILKLIALLLSVYSAILALRRLGAISLNNFIKGVLGALLGKVLACFSIQVDVSQTGIGCLINALNEIEAAIPSGKDVDQLVTQLGTNIQQVKNSVNTSVQNATNNVTNAVTGGTGALADVVLPNAQANIVNNFMSQIQTQTSGSTSDISSVFKVINTTVNQVVTDFNEQLNGMFGLIDYLQCELARSGTDFTDIMEYIQDIMNVINLLSSVAAIVAQKQLMAAFCATNNSTTALASVPPSVLYSGDSESTQTDIIAEYMGKVVDLTTNANGDVIPLIYNKDKPTILPKLDLYTCNLAEFIQAHTLENVTKAALENIIATQNAANLTSGVNTVTPIGTALPTNNYTNRDNWSSYTVQYTQPLFTNSALNTQKPSIDTPDIAILNNNAENAIQTILNFVYNNPLDRNSNTTTSPTSNNTNPGLPVAGNTNKVPYTSSQYTQSEKATFQNKCRDINDVLNLIKNI
jgi:hypothetical protein